jgi:hypothetical protein
VIGIYAAQRPGIGRLGLLGAVGYAYTFVFFTSTVVFALVQHTTDFRALKNQMGGWIAVHSVLMVVTGLVFGYAVVRPFGDIWNVPPTPAITQEAAARTVHALLRKSRPARTLYLGFTNYPRSSEPAGYLL